MLSSHESHTNVNHFQSLYIVAAAVLLWLLLALLPSAKTEADCIPAGAGTTSHSEKCLYTQYRRHRQPRRDRGYRRTSRYPLANWGKDRDLAHRYRIPASGYRYCPPAWNERKKRELDRHGYRCTTCRWESENPGDFNNDHKKAIKSGGSNHWRNLQILCAPCNTGKGDTEDTQWRANGTPYDCPKEWGLGSKKWANYHAWRKQQDKKRRPLPKAA